MANVSVIAKPYAKAAYEFARESEAVKHWSDALKTLKTIVLDEDVLNLISSPVCSQLQVAVAIEESFKKQFDEKRNLPSSLSALSKTQNSYQD